MIELIKDAHRHIKGVMKQFVVEIKWTHKGSKWTPNRSALAPFNPIFFLYTLHKS